MRFYSILEVLVSKSNPLRSVRQAKPISGLVATACACLGLLFSASALQAEEESWFRKNFVDPEDNNLDASEWLSKGGFLPLPLAITEPAIDNGLGIALGFIGPTDPDNDIPPDFTGAAALFTGNGSEVYAAFHEGTYANGKLKLSGFAALTDINLDFYLGSSTGLRYNINGGMASATATYQLGSSNWYAGGTWRYTDADVRFKGLSGSASLPLALNATLSGVGLVLDYYSLDNTFTPTSGTSARLGVIRFDDAVGSDFDYTKSIASVFTYSSPTDRLTLGGKFVAEAVNGNAPFFVLPAINLRGIPAIRYQGDAAYSAEFEATYRIADRWRVVGFTGIGWADDQTAGADRKIKATYGTGVRYRIARRLGIDLGLDIARGPEETVFYFQFGRAWRRF
ncbi:hypothetical protein BXY66_1741 [Shimia isoporae]|uniref:Surface antigen-like protein n=1 Tax=Shimia isoporae TaxID=647720 RepID=A0A4R1NNB9_9RHOB|nr:hypothetical protein [Shimia isoporae]TCL09685.1 hypothetical protein BXY66_1741 [Shimia isoporae]